MALEIDLENLPGLLNFLVYSVHSRCFMDLAWVTLDDFLVVELSDIRDKGLDGWSLS